MMVASAQVLSGPFAGQPHGFLNVVFPGIPETTDGVIALSLVEGMQWWGDLTDQTVFGAVMDAAPDGPTFLDVEGRGQYPVYSGDAVAEDVIAAGDYCWFGFDAALGAEGGFHLLNWSNPGGSGIALTTVGNSGPATFIGGVLNIPVYSGSGNIEIVTGAGPVTVMADDSVIVLNKAAPSDTQINLPEVALRNGLPLQIVDFNGNAQQITITPDGAETIMSLAQAVLISGGAGVGTAASIVLTPNVALGGWFQ